MGRVFVIGSLNVDFVVRAQRLPAAGQTVVGGDLDRHHGGKGGNQAVAAARVGGSVVFVGAAGRDELGDAAVETLRAEGVDVEHLARVDRPTGAALIVVDGAGQNLIAVAPGANAAVDAAMVDRALDGRIGPGDVVLTCREIPADAVEAALAAGRTAGATTILNPAPADGLTPAGAARAVVLTPNEVELTAIAGRGTPTQAARTLFSAGPLEWLVVTRGSDGALLMTRGGTEVAVPTPPVQPVDTVGAGDTFNGVLAARLAAGERPYDAVRYAVVAASLSTQRAGAREGMPTAAELERFVRSSVGVAR